MTTLSKMTDLSLTLIPCSSHCGLVSRTEDTMETAGRGGNLRGHWGTALQGVGGQP